MPGHHQGRMIGRNPHCIHRRPSRRRYLAAYTLYELVMTIGIVSILSTLAIPTYKLVRDQAMATQINLLLADINLARSEAVRTGIQTLVCKSSDGRRCDADTAWHQGWLVFHDRNENYQRDPGETIVRVRQALDETEQLRFSAWGPGIGRYLSYQPSGFTQQNGTFTLCDRSGLAEPRAVIIIRTGRARVSRTRSDGSPLHCS